MVMSRSHETVSLETIKKGGEKLHKPHFCVEHENEVLKLYCKTCSKAICGDCTYINHRDHEYIFIKDVRQELQQELEGAMEGLRMKEGELQEYLEGLHRAQADLEQGANAQACRQEVNRAFQSFVQRIQQCRDRVLEEIEKTEKADKKHLSAEADTTEVSLAKVSSNLSFIDRLLKSGSDTEVALMAAPTLKRVMTVHETVRQRNAEIGTDSALVVQSFKAAGKHIDQRFDMHVKEVEGDFMKVAHGQKVEDSQKVAARGRVRKQVGRRVVVPRHTQQPCLRTPVQRMTNDIVVEGIEKLSCGPSTLVINVEKKQTSFKLQVKVTQGTKEIPVTVTSISESSWIVSFLIREPGRTTIAVSVNETMAPGAPFVRDVEFKMLPIGTRVKRGPDWEWLWGDQDGGGLGTVIEQTGRSLHLRVKWDNGCINSCTWGRDLKSGEYVFGVQPV